MNTPPPQSSDVDYAPYGWTTEDRDPVVMWCTRDGTPIAELPIVSAQASDALNRADEATFSVSLASNPDLDALLMPWAGTVIVLVDQVPVWGGTIVKRRTALGKTALELVCREWSAWLERVWTTAAVEYISPTTPDDCATVILNRYQAGYALSAGHAVRPPWDGLAVSGSSGVEWELDFEDQSDEPSPQTIWQEVESILASGVELDTRWTYTGGRFRMSLEVSRFNPNASALEVVIGSDAVSTTLAVDSDQQATLVKVVGADDLTSVVSSSDLKYPPLWRVFSFDKVGSASNTDAEAQAQLDKIATDIHNNLKAPVLSADDVSLVGLRSRPHPGELVRIVVPPEFDDRFPEGQDAVMRVTEVTWEWSDAGRSTRLQLTTLSDAIPNTPTARGSGMLLSSGGAEAAPGSQGYVAWLRSLEDRLLAVESRRSASLAQAQQAGVPVGTVVAYSGASVPEGWLRCDGSAIPTQYSELRALVGANTPNLVDRFIKGAGGGVGNKTTGGTKTVPLPEHSHGADVHDGNARHDHAFGADWPDYQLPKWTSGEYFRHFWSVLNLNSTGRIAASDAWHDHGITINNAGTPGATMEPQFYALYYIIKAVA